MASKIFCLSRRHLTKGFKTILKRNELKIIIQITKIEMIIAKKAIVPGYLSYGFEEKTYLRLEAD